MSNVKGAGKVVAKMRGLTSPAARKAVYRGVFAGADMIRTDAALSISKGAPKTTAADGSKHHTPSLPGDPPNRDTAQLDTSIITSGSPEKLQAEVSANTPYALSLEIGDPERNLAPRPYMRPATAKNRDKPARLVALSIRRARGK